MPEGSFFNAVAGETPNTVVDPNVAPIGEAPPRPVATPATVEDDPNVFTHYVHLADGRVLRANLNSSHTDALGSRYYETNGDGEDAVETSVPIIGVYAR